MTKIDISQAMNTGWAKLPATKSVVASRAIAILDLWALSRRLVFTAIITNAFRAAVKGKEKMLMIIFKIRQTWAKGEGFSSLPPKITYIRHSWCISSLEFMMAFQIYLNSVAGLRTVHQINILSVNLLLFVLRWSCHMHLSLSGCFPWFCFLLITF